VWVLALVSTKQHYHPKDLEEVWALYDEVQELALYRVLEVASLHQAKRVKAQVHNLDKA